MRGQSDAESMLHRPLTMEEVLVHVHLTCEDQEFHGCKAEGEADAWLRRHVLKGLAWEWILTVTVELENGAVVTTEHVVTPGHTNGSVRTAIVHYLVTVSQDESVSQDTRTVAHVLAHQVQGKPLPVPVMRQTWDLDTWGLVLKPAPHQYHSGGSGIEAPSDTRRPFQRTP